MFQIEVVDLNLFHTTYDNCRSEAVVHISRDQNISIYMVLDKINAPPSLNS